MMRTVCIIQARMGSTRLPGKVLRPLLGRPMLWWVVHRARQARLLDEVVVATTLDARDDQLDDLCCREGWGCFRGSEEDVLDRYYQAAKHVEADVVVRITSDCPLIDPRVIDHVTAAYFAGFPHPDYVSIFEPRTYPRGLDTEVFSMKALETAWREDTSAWREHVTPYIYRNPDRFRLLSVCNPVDYAHHRWTVDTPEDLELVTRIYEHFGHGDFRWGDVIGLLERNPEWAEINRHVEQKNI
jgi:spore coat polysaccharide biosynthesis protein SpsF